MNKYDTDMEAIDLKITIMKNKYQDEVARRKGMEEDVNMLCLLFTIIHPLVPAVVYIDCLYGLLKYV